MFKKKKFKIFLLFAIKMAVLSVFSQRKGLGLLGVNQKVFDILKKKSFNTTKFPTYSYYVQFIKKILDPFLYDQIHQY